jgi:ATPase subunit of ABC transporter with duplicated ATPase domains
MRASSKERKQQQAMHEKGPEKESRTKQLWKRNGNLAQKDQASQDVQEKDATTMGTGTDMAVPVSEDVDNEEHENHDSHRSSMQFTQDPQVKDVNIIIPRGQLCAIVGPVGAGKSSLLSAMIGEMKRLSGTVVFGGTVGYCAQQAWIQNATL